MRCSKARQYLSLAIDEQLPPAETRELDEHLDRCGECREYRNDLMVGRRLLSATGPTLSDNFDWRLQLKLTQTLQQAVGETAYPWHDVPAPRRGWIDNFTTSAAMGLAAVLALAMFLGPVAQTPSGGRVDNRSVAPSTSGSSTVTDRLPLTRETFRNPFAGPRGIQQSVSQSGGLMNSGRNSFSLDRGWSGSHVADLVKIKELQDRNRQLNNQIYHYQKRISILREQLDSPDSNALDLEGQ